MTHPLVYMLAHRPQMLVVHAQAYADLLSADASLALRQAKLKALLGLLTAPGISWAMAMALAWATYRTPVSHALSEIKRQVYADMALCKELRVA